MKEIDYSKNIQLHIKVQNKPEEWRLGQAYFNYAEELYPEESNQLRGTEYDCFYNDEKIPEFLEKLNEKLLEFDGCTIGGRHRHINNIEFEEKPLVINRNDINGKSDNQFVNDKIQELRKKRNELQNKIYELSNQLNKLKEEQNNTQKEIDEEFLKQEHAYDLIGKCILFETDVYHVKNVERQFYGIRICSDWSYNTQTKSTYCSPYKIRYCSISFNELSAILSENKFIPIEEAAELFKQYMLK